MNEAGVQQSVTRLVGVYNGDGTVRGELAYFIGARLGRAHCALCEITHGLVRERSEFRRCRENLPVAFDRYHRDDQPAAVRDAADGIAPVVLAETESGPVMLLGPEELESCKGSVDKLAVAIEAAMSRAGLEWPAQAVVGTPGTPSPGVN